MALAKGNTGKPAVLRALDLSSGKVKKSYAMPAGSFCNDIATSKNDTVYVTDTHGGRIMRLSEGKGSLQTWFKDKDLVGVDGIALGKDGALYLTNVQSNELLKLDVAANGKPGKLTKLQLSEPVKAPDGLRSTNDGHFYLSENKSGKVDEVTVEGDRAMLKTVKDGYQGPTSTTMTNDRLYVAEAKINQYGQGKTPGPFYVYALPAPTD
jgi:sugar lactone lactonase YvrE